jgi:hypothetical protein
MTAARVITDLVACPDCGLPAVISLGGDHSGTCLLDLNVPAERLTAADIIRRHAQTHDVLSANELRADMDRHGIAPEARGPALGAAVKAGWLRRVGHVASTDKATKGHEVSTYESLLYPTERKRSA